MFVELTTFKTSFACKKLKTNAECLPPFLHRHNVVIKVLRRHLIVIFSLFSPQKGSLLLIDRWMIDVA